MCALRHGHFLCDNCRTYFWVFCTTAHACFTLSVTERLWSVGIQIIFLTDVGLSFVFQSTAPANHRYSNIQPDSDINININTQQDSTMGFNADDAADG